MLVTRIALNTKGRDLIVGDIHGCYTKLQEELDARKFDPTVDRLFCVGDLVDRGPESEEALTWLKKPWFFSILGNHEQAAIDAARHWFDESSYRQLGGQWFIDLDPNMKELVSWTFEQLPVIIELETANGTVGLVHGDIFHTDWNEFVKRVEEDDGKSWSSIVNNVLWGRGRITGNTHGAIANVRAVILGHTPVSNMKVIDNTYYIDTGAVYTGGKFTFLNAENLEIVL